MRNGTQWPIANANFRRFKKELLNPSDRVSGVGAFHVSDHFN